MAIQHVAVRKRYRGILRLWNEPRYFGFIDIDKNAPMPDLRETIFAHRLHFMKGMKPFLGCKVEFEIGPPNELGKPNQAVRVKVLNPEEHPAFVRYLALQAITKTVKTPSGTVVISTTLVEPGTDGKGAE